jgi:DNA-binding response OmpR family regulator
MIAVELTRFARPLETRCFPMKTILLVEDDKPLSNACAQILTRAGYSVITADNGDMAVATFQLTPVDLLVVDMFLPGKDGYEVIDACRRIRPTVPILGMSGGGGFAEPYGLLHGARELGAMVTIAKPFAQSELLQVVELILQQGPKPKERWSIFDLLRRPKAK